MESVAFIQWCLDHLNYWTITLLMTIESSFIPFPSEVVIPPAAYKAAVNDELNIYLVILFATIGANIGALIFISRWKRVSWSLLWRLHWFQDGASMMKPKCATLKLISTNMVRFPHLSAD